MASLLNAWEAEQIGRQMRRVNIQISNNVGYIVALLTVLAIIVPVSSNSILPLIFHFQLSLDYYYFANALLKPLWWIILCNSVFFSLIHRNKVIPLSQLLFKIAMITGLVLVFQFNTIRLTYFVTHDVYKAFNYYPRVDLSSTMDCSHSSKAIIKITPSGQLLGFCQKPLIVSSIKRIHHVPKELYLILSSNEIGDLQTKNSMWNLSQAHLLSEQLKSLGVDVKNFSTFVPLSLASYDY